MAQNIKLKRSSVAGKVPSGSQLIAGELAMNTADGKLFFKNDADAVKSIVTVDSTQTGSLTLTGDITANAFNGDGSGVTGVVSSSYSVTSSFADNVIVSFTGLTDTPASLSGHGRKVVTVNSGETALEFSDSVGELPTVGAVKTVDQQFTTETVITSWSAAQIEASPAFYLWNASGGELEITTNGNYLLNANFAVNVYTGSVRSQSEIWLETFDGTVWSVVDGTRRQFYNRTEELGGASAAITWADTLSSGSRFRFKASRSFGDNTLQVEDASFIVNRLDAFNITNFTLPVGTVSGSGQITLQDATGDLSGSRIVGDIQASSVAYANVLNKPTLYSASVQVDIDATSGTLTTLGTVTGGDITAILPAGSVSASAQVGLTSTTGYVSNEHINHGDVTLTAGAGLTGGGDITTSRSFLVGAGDGITVNADDVQVDSSVLRTTGTVGVVSASAQIALTGLSDYDANDHIDHTSVTLTAGDGLSGGGDISTNRTFTLNTGSAHFVTGSWNTLTAGTGIAITDGSISSDDSAIAHDSLSGFVANEHIDHTGVTLTAGAGLTGGGDISSNRTFNIGAGTGVTVNADDIAIGQDVATNADVTFNSIQIDGYVSSSGHIVPGTNDTYDLGSPNLQWRDLYLSSGSLYIDGTKILESNASQLVFTTDTGQDLIFQETGADDIALQTDSGNIQLQGTVQIQTGKRIIDSAGAVVQFGDNLGVTGSVTATSFSGDGANVSNVTAVAVPFSGVSSKPTLLSSSAQINSNGIFDLASGEVTQLANIGSNTVSAGNWGYLNSLDQDLGTTDNVTFHTGSFTGDLTVTGNLTISGETTTVESNTVNIGDNIIVLNSDEVGTPSQNAGVQINRGTSANVDILYNESTDAWTFTNNGTAYYDIPTAAFSASAQVDVTATTGYTTNWNTAYGWGDHGTQGYALASLISGSWTPDSASLAADIVTAQAAADAAQSDLDGFEDGLSTLTSGEVQQLNNINSNTITDTQWSYVGNLNQNLRTTDDVTFDAITATSYGGITEANLLDKSASETISGTWTFSGVTNNSISIQAGNGSDSSIQLIETGGSTFTLSNDAGDSKFIIADDSNDLFTINDVTGNVWIGGTLTAASYGGITEANLLDKSATETVSGVWSFSANNITVGDGGTNGVFTFDQSQKGLIKVNGSSILTLSSSLDTLAAGAVSASSFEASGNATINGNLGAGVSPSYTLDVYDQMTELSGTQYMSWMFGDVNPATGSAATYIGLRPTLEVTGSNTFDISTIQALGPRVFHWGTGTVTNMRGLQGVAKNKGEGVVTNAFGVRMQLDNEGTGTITTGIGAQFEVGNSSTGTLTTGIGGKFFLEANNGIIDQFYGIYVGDTSLGTHTNTPYNLYISDTDALNYLAGDTSISGSTSITGSITATGAISGTTIGGITEANLVDKSATEAITGAWTFANNVGLVSASAQIDVTATTGYTANWNTAYGWGDHGAQGYLVNSNLGSLNAETASVDGRLDVIQAASSSWDTAFGWGDHSAGGYAATSTTMTAGSGLTGGGTLASGRTFNVGAGDGISVAADSVAVDATVLRTTGDAVVSASAQIDHDSTTNYVSGEHFTQANITTVGTIGTGVWNGTAIASAYLDADTAHLSGTQTFSGAKTFGAASTFSSTATFNGGLVSVDGANHLRIRAGKIQLENASSTNSVYIYNSGGAGVSTLDMADGAFSLVESTGALTLTGALTAASYGGITEANLLDKSATETVSGAWTFGNDVDVTGNISGSAATTGSFGYVNVDGHLEATTKSFLIDHPTETGKKLQYGVLEGPEHAVYVRGKTTDETIVLPSEWQGLVDNNTITVQLTSIGGPNAHWVESVSNTTVTIGAEDGINCFYFIQGERKDVGKLVTEFDA